MKLKINSKCQLILDGQKPLDGLEVLVYEDNYVVINREHDDYWVFEMPCDGLFQYFVLNFNEEPEDLLTYIQTNSILPESEIFSICKLRACLLQKEREYISNFLSNCNRHCSNISDIDVEKDFLLSTVFVLEHLICIGQTVEANRILKNLKSCSLCDEAKSTNCGCNGQNK